MQKFLNQKLRQKITKTITTASHLLRAASTGFNESAGSSQNQILDIDSFAAPLTPIFNSILSFSGFGGSSSNRDEEEEEDELDGDLEEMKKDISFEVVEQSIDASNANGLGGKKKVVKVERSMKAFAVVSLAASHRLQLSL